MYQVNLSLVSEIPDKWKFINGIFLNMLLNNINACHLSSSQTELQSWVVASSEKDDTNAWFASAFSAIDSCSHIYDFFSRFGNERYSTGGDLASNDNYIGNISYSIQDYGLFDLFYVLSRKTDPFSLTLLNFNNLPYKCDRFFDLIAQLLNHND